MSRAPAIEVLAPGLATSVQDAGREGLRALGVGRAGALDGYSLAVANLLVGNDPGAAALEITLEGPALRLPRRMRVALAGAEVEASAGGRALPRWRPVVLPAGTELAIGRCRRGARAILAVDGGLDTPVVLGSRSTDLRAGIGGPAGRVLQAGDRLPLGRAADAPGAEGPSPWWVDPAPELDFDLPAVLRCLPGRDALDEASRRHCYDDAFRASAQGDRTGLRIEGPRLALERPESRSSEPVLPGTIQLPPHGQPIVLLGECGSHGGYPRIGHVIAADQPRLAQLRPGETLRFAPCTLAEADAANAAHSARLARMALAIASRLGR